MFMEIIEKTWTRDEIASALGKALQTKTGLEALGADTTDIETKISAWRDKYAELE